MAESVQQFAARIKTKYPDYAQVPDDELVKRVIAKYPEYAGAVKLDRNPNENQFIGPETMGEKASRYLKTAVVHGPEMIGQLVGGVLGGAGGSVPGAVGGAALGAGAGRSVTNLARTASPTLDRFAQNGGMDPLPASSRQAAREVGTAAAIGGAGELAGQVGARMLKPAASVLQNAAVKQYGQALNPTTKPTKYEAQAVIPRLLKDRQVILSGKSFEEKAAQKVAGLGEQINEAVAKVPASVKPETRLIVNSLEKYKQGYIVNGVPIDAAAVKHATELQEIVQNLGDDVSFQSLNRVRQIWDKSVSQAKGFAGKSLAEGSMVDAQKEAANAARRELARQSPDIAKINAEFHFWRQVENVIEETNQRKVGQVGAWRVARDMGAMGLGMAHSTEWAITAAVLSEITQAPAWRTASAILKNEVADALASGSTAKLIKLGGRMGVPFSATVLKQLQEQPTEGTERGK